MFVEFPPFEESLLEVSDPSSLERGKVVCRAIGGMP